jgi:hypothetical protein
VGGFKDAFQSNLQFAGRLWTGERHFVLLAYCLAGAALMARVWRKTRPLVPARRRLIRPAILALVFAPGIHVNFVGGALLPAWVGLAFGLFVGFLSLLKPDAWFVLAGSFNLTANLISLAACEFIAVSFSFLIGRRRKVAPAPR